jgi:hypothetical protein
MDTVCPKIKIDWIEVKIVKSIFFMSKFILDLLIFGNIVFSN